MGSVHFNLIMKGDESFIVRCDWRVRLALGIKCFETVIMLILKTLISNLYVILVE